MTEKVNPSINRPAEAFKTAGAIALAGGAGDGWIVRGSSPTDIATQDAGIDETAFNTFAESHSASSFDITIDPGEGFVYGSWLAIDTSTTVTLSSNTANQTVYVGWNKGGTNDVIIGLASAFSTASGDTDEKIPLFDFDTDGSGVTAVTNRRTIGKTVDGRFVSNTATYTTNSTTDGEQIVFADSSGGAITVTLATQDLDEGNNVIVVDAGGAAGTNTITIDTEGSATINGSSSITIEDDYGAKAIASDGTNWYTSGAGGGGGAFKDDDADGVAELITGLTGVQFKDDETINFGTGDDFLLQYDSTNDWLQISDGTNDLMRISPTGPISFLTGNLQLDGDGLKLLYGADQDVSSRYDASADDLRWRDETNALDRMALDRTTGDLSIEGQLTEGATL